MATKKTTKKTWRSWGKFRKQTVKKHRTHKSIVIRQGRTYITVRHDEVDSLVVAALKMRGAL